MAGADPIVILGAGPTGLGVPALPIRVDLVAVEPAGRIRHHRGVG